MDIQSKKAPPFNIVTFALIWSLIYQLLQKSQHSTEAASYKAGAMKHKEEGYCLFRDDHFMMVRFHPCSITTIAFPCSC